MRTRWTRLILALCGTALVAAVATGCLPGEEESLPEVDVPSASTTTSSTAATETSTTSTTVAPTTSTTTTTAPWPRTPVSPRPAAGAAPVLSRIDTPDPVIFLTLDDGMVRDPRVLELVEKFRIPVTLFLNEGPMRADPDYFRRITAFGGSINSHTRSHPKLATMSTGAQKSQICGMRDVIGEYVWIPGHLFRSPFGVTPASTQSVVTQCGINAVLFWRVALNDGMVQYQQGHELQRGDIVLGHFREDLYDNLQALWWQAASQGLTIAPIEAYLPLP